jgi:hypothetical protein
MRVNTYRSLAFFLFIALAYSANAQISPGTANPNPAPHMRPAYTAEFKITSQQTLADGTVITRESTEIDAQDSEGRHMHSVTEETPQLGRAPGTFVNANDPVEGTQSTWDSRTKKARVIKLPPQDQRQGCWANDAGTVRMSWHTGGQTAAAGNSFSFPSPSGSSIAMPLPPARQRKPEVADLGTATVDGLEAHGHRFTTTVQPGEIGNDEPIITISEVWTSSVIPWPVREVTDDPRSGRRTRELVDLTQSEPDPTTFQPPEGYSVSAEELHQVTCPNAQ